MEKQLCVLNVTLDYPPPLFGGYEVSPGYPKNRQQRCSRTFQAS
jgi:hypothetical protein